MPYTIYLSSTLKDLASERQAVKDALGSECVVNESYGASEQQLIASCIDDVSKSDVYIGIVGLRYGYVPTDSNPGGLSITELEYEEALKKNLPRLIFVKREDRIAASDTDALTGEQPKKRIEDFRGRVGGGADQRPALFGDAHELKYLVEKGFNAFKARREGAKPLLISRTSHPAELVTDVTVVCVRGTDDAQKNAIVATGDKRFVADDLSLDDQDYVFSLDKLMRRARAVCMLVSSASLSRFRTKTDLVEAALRSIRDRCGQAFLMLDGVASASLPGEWQTGNPHVIELTAGQLTGKPAESLVLTYGKVREHSPAIANDRRIGVPYLLIALDQQQAQALQNDAGAAFATYGLSQQARQLQFDALTRGLSVSGRSWPKDYYGASSVDWRPFGKDAPTAEEFLVAAVDRINALKGLGGRSRRLLGDYRLQLRRYVFEDYRVKRLGSRAMLEDVREQGCLILVDELALIHPDVRKDVDPFLTTQSAAVVSTHACDPSSLSTADILGDVSHLRVGSLFQRFRDDRDARCELSLNSPARFERWLNFVLPELVSTLGHVESRPDLVERADTLLN